MILLDTVSQWFPAPRLTRGRIVLALGVAIGADALQWLLAPLALAGFFADEIIDVIAMVLTARVLGFHVLLLPTFLLEFMPLVGMLPTWTGCVIAVIALRKNKQSASAPPPVQPAPSSPSDSSPYIDI